MSISCGMCEKAKSHDISRRITEKVITLAVDLGIVVNPLRHPDLVIQKLCEDETTFWVGPGKRAIQNIYSKQAVILCDPDLTQTQSLLKKMKRGGVVTDRVMTMNSLEVVAALTAQGCGIGILPARVANALYPHQLKRVAKAPSYLDEICLIYRGENRAVRAMQTLIKAIQSSL